MNNSSRYVFVLFLIIALSYGFYYGFDMELILAISIVSALYLFLEVLHFAEKIFPAETTDNQESNAESNDSKN